jgi:tRNA-specific 2-thiouridylase
MDGFAREVFELRVGNPRNHGYKPLPSCDGFAGGSACGDTIRISVQVRGDRVTDAGFEAAGCGALRAAGSAVMDMIIGEPVLDAARIGTEALDEEMGGLTPGKFHVVVLAADALAQALGAAAAAGASLASDPDRTLVAMSGGVDSSLVALLAAESGRSAVGVTVELWRDTDNDAESSCCSISAVRQARTQAHRLGMAHFTLDLRDEFRAGVVEPFVEGFRQGQTPNPCVSCNGDVRLDAMLALADRLGADTLTTGHYTRVIDDGQGPLLAVAADAAKDQSYMLAGLKEQTLARLRFPLGDWTKPQVREMATERQLVSARKPDSQDLCFLAGTTRPNFLARHGAIVQRAGDIVDLEGAVLGSHQGVQNYTVGQRRGLGVPGSEPYYVLRLDAAANQVIVGPREQLNVSEVPLAGLSLRRDSHRVTHVKLRYKSTPVACELTSELSPGRHRRAALRLREPAEGVAPGQTACLMDGDTVVGLATIAPR